MFNFDVHEDIRLTHDAAIEKDEVRYFALSHCQVARTEFDSFLLTSLAVPRRKGYREELVQPE